MLKTFYVIIAYILYGSFLVWRDFHLTNFANRPLYAIKKPDLKMIIFAIFSRPCEAPYFFIANIIMGISRKHTKEKVNNNGATAKEDDKIKFFEDNIKNTDLIYRAGGDLPIEANNITEIMIKNKKEIIIEFRQIKTKSINENGAWYQVPFYAIGHLKCCDCEYLISQTKTTGPAFYLYRGDDGRLEIIINRNLQAIKIHSPNIELTDFAEVNIGIKEFADLDNQLKAGQLFSIKNNG